MIEINVNRKDGDFGFDAIDVIGHTLKMDTSPESGGINFGIRPMQVVLMGMGGCSAIDIVMILKKQRQTIDDFSMKIEGEREDRKDPSLWKNVKIVFELKGDIDVDKAERACELSINKYCSVAETLRRGGTNITWEVRVNPKSATEATT